MPTVAKEYENFVSNIFVYDDGVIKGFIQIENTEIKKLFVEPIFQNLGIGSILLDYAIQKHNADRLWALEKNIGAISFYEQHNFQTTSIKKLVEGANEYLIFLKRQF